MGSASEYVQTILGERCTGRLLLCNANSSCETASHRVAALAPSVAARCACLARRLATQRPCPCAFVAGLSARSPSCLPCLCSTSAACPAARCIDTYVEQRVAEAEGRREGGEGVDPRLVAVVERLFERCFADRQFEQAVGIALESRRLDQLERAIASSPGELRRRRVVLGVRSSHPAWRA